MQVEFFGAAGEVTGSCHLVRAAGKVILIDCGMIQGGREEHLRNAEPFPFDVGSIDAVLLSHAHIDHVGRMPLLVKRGYRGPIHTHPATVSLSKIMLEDSAKIAASDAAYVNKRREARGDPPVVPLYEVGDVDAVMDQFEELPYDQWKEILPGVRLRLRDAGHIIGAAIIELHADQNGATRKLVFSGDIGPKGTPMLRDPTAVDQADMVMMESTYGDRLHRNRGDTVEELGRIFAQAHRDQGNVLIPAFAVGRTQELLYWFAQHYKDWRLDQFRIVIDSPMATKVIGVYEKHCALFDEEALRVWKGPHHPFKLPNLTLIESVEESRALNHIEGGVIIIAGSGMCNGGRIKHHLRNHLGRRSTHVIFPGYQAHGTLGRELVDGAERVRIYGEEIQVNAQRHTIGGLSAHADQAGLMEWYGNFRDHPSLYLVHGEDSAREVLAQLLRERDGAKVTLAKPGMLADV